MLVDISWFDAKFDYPLSLHGFMKFVMFWNWF